jgi:hypothetical protein
MHITTATKLGEIMEAAAYEYRRQMDIQFAYDSFAECVGAEFWKAFGVNEQSQLMQEVYSVLCDMGFTPLESLK